jgi:hypothetical protein
MDPATKGMIKINVDVAVGKNGRCDTVATIARTKEGVFSGASRLVFPGKSGAETLEALAVQGGLRSGQGHRWSEGYGGNRLQECYS